MESAVIYCRKSDASALPTDVSFDDQEQCCKDYAKEKGYSVYKVYRESHSGADLLHRPKIWEAIEDIRRGNAQILLVRNYDRLARKSEHASVIKHEVKEKCKGRIESALDPNDEETLTDKIMDLVAEAERQHAMVRMERGKHRRVERGHLMGASNPTFGYRWLDDEPGKRTAYVEDSETAPVVRRIFRMVLAGKSLRDIARALNDDKIPTPGQVARKHGLGGRKTVGDSWSHENVRRLIIDRTYTGEKIAFKYQAFMHENGKRVIALRTAGDEQVKLTVPALIDQATFDVAQSLLSSKSKSGRPPLDKEVVWLRGHVRCASCGSRMRPERAHRDGSHYYRCPNRPTGDSSGHVCPGGDVSIRAYRLDSYAYEGLASILTHLEPFREVAIKRLGINKVQALASMAEGYQAQIAEKRELLETARKRSLQTKDDELAQSYINDAEALNEEVHHLEKEYTKARDQLDHFNAGNAWIDAAIDRIRKSLPQDVPPTPEDIKALSYDDRWLLLEVTGMVVLVSPSGTEGGRLKVVYLLPTDDAMAPDLKEATEAWWNKLANDTALKEQADKRWNKLTQTKTMICTPAGNGARASG